MELSGQRWTSKHLSFSSMMISRCGFSASSWISLAIDLLLEGCGVLSLQSTPAERTAAGDVGFSRNALPH